MFPDISKKLSKSDLSNFAEAMKQLSDQIGFKVSSRGWCYLLEGERVINKDQFDKAENYINNCRRNGLLPVDFVAEEEGRQFSGVETPEGSSVKEYIRGYVQSPLNCANWYTPDWWQDEQYYIQMLVEKIDLKTLFEPVCEQYHIPIATSKGWSSILQRATYARRFKEAEDKGLKCVLLYCGDHDPDGLRISDFIRSNLAEISDIEWEDGERGYDPDNLIIQRFGLDTAFIIKHKLTWIDNLITGSRKNLASPLHKNFTMPYVQQYLKTIGERKCEANAIVPFPVIARNLVTEAIEEYLGDDALSRFKAVRSRIVNEAEDIFEATGLKDSIQRTLDYLDND